MTWTITGRVRGIVTFPDHPKHEGVWGLEGGEDVHAERHTFRSTTEAGRWCEQILSGAIKRPRWIAAGDLLQPHTDPQWSTMSIRLRTARLIGGSARTAPRLGSRRVDLVAGIETTLADHGVDVTPQLTHALLDVVEQRFQREFAALSNDMSTAASQIARANSRDRQRGTRRAVLDVMIRFTVALDAAKYGRA